MALGKQRQLEIFGYPFDRARDCYLFAPPFPSKGESYCAEASLRSFSRTSCKTLP